MVHPENLNGGVDWRSARPAESLQPLYHGGLGSVDRCLAAGACSRMASAAFNQISGASH
jgi:hypothetical protein